MQIVKKDGTLEEFDEQKIINAVQKSASRVMIELTPNDYSEICNNVWQHIEELDSDEELIQIQEIHNMVEATLDEFDPLIAKSYRDYRNYKQDFIHMMDDVYTKSQSIRYIGDKSNANTDSALVATKRSLIFNELNKALYKKFFMTKDELQACKDGYIYIHDQSARLDTVNCCLFDVATVLKDGFEMGNVWYNEPKSLDTAFDVIGDIILSTAAQQYGGFTVPEIDKVLAPYAEKSYQKYRKEYLNIIKNAKSIIVCGDQNCIYEDAKVYADNKVKRDFEQGWQGVEYKLNTVGSSRGDYPFVTVTIGLGMTKFEKMASITLLQVHQRGQGKDGSKKPVLFPKIVFLYDEEIHGVGGINEDIFEAGIECSSKTMYPDWLSMSGKGYISSMYKKYKKVISPMGCVDGNETITYKYNNKLYVESFKRMWNRLGDSFEAKQQHERLPHLYMDLNGIEIYDTEKGFVNTKRIIRNVSKDWLNVKMSNGRSLMCTSDHPFSVINKGRVPAKDLIKTDTVMVNSSQYFDENILFNKEKAWLLGFMLCDGCYSNNGIFASIAATDEDEIEDKFIYTMKKFFELEIKTVLQERGVKGTYKDLCVIGNNDGRVTDTINYFTSKFGGLNKKNRQIPNEVFSWDYNSRLSFLAGMIDADGYVNPNSHGGSIVQIGSTNKELALQQMALAQTLDMPARVYQNHYSKANTSLIRYRIEFYPSDELIDFLVCQKKKDNYISRDSSSYNAVSTINEIIPIDIEQYSYDVTTDSDHFEVSGIYSHNCRAFLSPWYEQGGINPINENDVPVFVGRFNIGAVSLHLPMILAKSKTESKDFYEVLDYYLEMIRQLHIRTYDYIGEMKASTNPLAYCEGGFYGGKLKPTDKIKSLLKPMTASFGITALNELQQLYNKKSLVEDGQFAIEVMEYINKKIIEFKEEDEHLYAIYGTPAESLCGLQVEQFRKKYGIIENVSDRAYVSNSFHCHVSEDITPIQKQDLENRFWELFNGGKIQYVKYPISYNKEAIRTLIRRAMNLGDYEGVNLELSYCDDCGYEQLDMEICPICGSKNLTKISRMNGYLSFSRVHGDTRLNESKMAEIADRKSM